MLSPLKSLFRISILFGASVLLSTSMQAQNIVINELMSENVSTIQDEDGDFSDWIELYNAGTEPANLSGFTISDDAAQWDKWTIPAVNIEPQGFIILYASSKDRVDPNNELHTNFNISSNGESLYLSDSEGALIDQTENTPLGADKSFCRLPDGGSNWLIPIASTPDSSNEINNDLAFSPPGGFYPAPFWVNISTVTNGLVRCTFDGRTPTINSEAISEGIDLEFLYDAPNVYSEIPTTPDASLINTRAWESPGYIVHKAHVLRCATFQDGLKTSPVVTHTYFVDSTIQTKYTVPVISLVSDPANIFEPDSGIYVPGDSFNPGSPGWTGNYYQSGSLGERDVHIEYFLQNGSLEFSQNAGVRIHGISSRRFPQKSLRLYARNEYNKKYFDYPLLPQSDNNQYKRFLLRSTMGADLWDEQTVIKDVLCHELVRDLDVDFQNYRPVVVYMNGEYWGIHSLRDRIDQRYISYLYDIHHDDVEFREDGSVHYENLMSFVENQDLSNPVNYEYVLTQIEIENFIDYQIAEMFLANFDWPTNNVKMWRPKTPEGKWRWIFFDLDAAMWTVDHNMFEHATQDNENIGWPNSPESTLLFRQLLENNSFREQFISRYAEILNNEFAVANTTEKLEEIMALYSPEIEQQSMRWHYPESVNAWETEVESFMHNFLVNRPCYVEEHLTAFFGIESFGFECTTGIQEEDRSRFMVSPNPGYGVVRLHNNSGSHLSGDVLVSNLTGHTVFHKKTVHLPMGSPVQIDLSHLVSGTYLLTIMSDQHRETKRIIILSH